MGEVSFKHAGRTGTTIRFPYTPRGASAIRRAERVVRRLSLESRGKRARKPRRAARRG